MDNILEETRFIMKKYNIKANKNLGQNFLINEEVVKNIVGCSNIEKEDLVIEIGPGLGTLTKYLLEKAGKVICIELDTKMLQILEDRFPDFLNQNKDNLDSCEYLIPIVLNELVEEGKKQVNVIETTSVWYGITYKEDKDLVTNAIKKLVEMGVYPQNLWSE